MKLFKDIFLIALSFLAISSFSQESVVKSVDEDYDNFGYIRTTEVLLKVAEKGYKSVELFKKLANSYYFNNNLKEAARWYYALMEMNPKDLDPEYYFRYAQSLKGIENYEESDKWMLKYYEDRSTDGAGRSFLNEVDYLVDITKPRYGDLQLHNISINTKYSEFGATPYKNQIVFASTRGGGKRYRWNEQPFLDLYTAIKNDIGEYSEIERLGKKVNSKFHESSATFTPDGKNMYFTRNNYFNKNYGEDSIGVNRLKLFRASLNPIYEWDDVAPVHFNSDEYSTAHATINTQGTVMYFASDMPGSLGLSDIFRVEVNEDGSLGVPTNLGIPINTEREESFPFINKSGDLFFASNGHLGLGGLDIFVVRNFEEHYKNGEEIIVENLGVPFNSPLEDFAYSEDHRSKEGYMSSNREGGVGDDDIYSFPVPECNPILNGTVRDLDTNEIINDARISLFDKDDNEILTIDLEATPYFEIILKCEKEYVVRADKEGYISDEKQITTPYNMQELLMELHLDKDEHIVVEGDDLAETLDIPIIYFDFDKHNIRYDAEVELQKLLIVLNEYPTMEIDIRSHTDCRGSAQYNEALSERRAQSTKKYLIDNGINQDRLTAKGYGESQLVNHCACEEGVDALLNVRNEISRVLTERTDPEFLKVVETDSIKFYGTRQIPNVESGYYLIANVYSKNYHFNRFVKSLIDKGLNPDHFVNSENDWKYVYLKYSDNWQEIVSAYNSQLNGMYQDELWILNVDNSDFGNELAKEIIEEKSLSKKGIKREYINFGNSQESNADLGDYFVIANVFRAKTNADNFIKSLAAKNISANYFVNSTNNWTYVYLKRTNTWKEARAAQISKVEGNYNNATWILRILGLGESDCSEAEHQLNRRSEFIITKM
jgi:outer membrane protein OmpA-like peptidoglycan-associated protein